jgi:hypothetical protein
MTVTETIVLLGILAFLASSMVVVESRDLRFLRDSHDRAAALRACAARLEEYAAGLRVPEPGERAVEVPAVLAERFPGSAATETVRPAGEGLVEVEVRFRWRAAGGDGREARLATLVATGAPR